jgi:hypothetical protein
VLHKATIKATKLEKNTPRPIKPQAHPTPSLWYVSKGGMGLVNWEWKIQNPSKFANTFQHFATTNTFTRTLQFTVGH